MRSGLARWKSEAVASGLGLFAWLGKPPRLESQRDLGAGRVKQREYEVVMPVADNSCWLGSSYVWPAPQGGRGGQKIHASLVLVSRSLARLGSFRDQDKLTSRRKFRGNGKFAVQK
ncbi:hypothetical protein Bbelb_198750 [Branchiostoma belcheri]|nr:hypothetical protein Bbelb_198750 [Branchiostoma belcheri]